MKRGLRVRGIFLLAVVAFCLLGLGYAAERILQRRTGQSWLLNGWNDLGPSIHDPLLGWTSPPSTHWPDLYGPGRHCTFNARGFRAVEEYPDDIQEGRIRVLCLGDSFMAGLGLGNESTIPAQLERLRPDVQAVNMAKISYGLDQAILRYERDGEGLEADYVLLTAIDDDLNRARWDHFFGYWPKPRFAVDADGLRLTGVPVPDFSAAVASPVGLIRRSALYLLPHQYLAERRYDHNDHELATRLLDRFRKLAEKRGHRAMLAYFPTLPEVRSGERLPFAKVLETYAARHSLPLVSFADALTEASFLEVNEHYSAEGSRQIAQEIAEAIPTLP